MTLSTMITATIGSTYLSMCTLGPSARPSSTMSWVQRMPPTTFQIRNARAGISATPQTGLMNVRTTGTNRETTIAML